MRLSIERAIETSEGRELTRYARVLLAGLHWTASRSWLWDGVYVAQLVELAAIAGDVDGKHTKEMLHLLDERGVLIWRPSTVTGRRSWLGLPGSLPRQLPILSSVSAAGGPLSAPATVLSGPPSEVDLIPEGVDALDVGPDVTRAREAEQQHQRVREQINRSPLGSVA